MLTKETNREHQQDVLAYNCQQAASLGVSYLPEVVEANELLQLIIHARGLLQSAISLVEQEALEEAVAAADAFNYTHEEVFSLLHNNSQHSHTMVHHTTQHNRFHMRRGCCNR